MVNPFMAEEVAFYMVRMLRYVLRERYSSRRARREP